MILTLVIVLGLVVMVGMSSIRVMAVFGATDKIHWSVMVTALGIGIRFKDSTIGRLYIGPLAVKKIFLSQHPTTTNQSTKSWPNLNLVRPTISTDQWRNRIEFCWNYLQVMSTSCGGCLRFGFSDPYLTGVACAFVNMIAPAVNTENLQVTPNFCYAELDGKITVRCTGNVGGLLWLTLKLTMRYTYRQVKKYLGRRYWKNEFCKQCR